METSESTMIHNLWDAAKPVIRRKFIALQAYYRKQGKVQINNLTLYLKKLKNVHTKPKVRMKE